MVDVPWPLSNNPGLKPQEGTGKLINVFVEPRGDGTPVWRRAPGASVFAREPSSGSANMDFNANARGGTFFSTFFELVGSSTTNYAQLTTNEIVYPPGTQSGDVVFLLSGSDGAESSWTTPTGFTPLAANTSPGLAYSLMYKACTGETTTSFINPSSNRGGVTLAFAIRGAMSTAPIVDTAAVSTGASGDPHPTSFTNTTADSLIITCAWVDDDNASAAAIATTAVVSGATTFNCGHPLLAVTTESAEQGASVMVAFRPMATTGVYNFSTGNSPAWAVTGGDDEWVAMSFTVRHD